MRSLLTEALILAAALGLSAAAVHGWHDRTTLVPPPAAVVEEFLRALAAGRYEAAREKLADDLRHEFDENRLRMLTEGLQDRHGAIRHVEGQDRSIGTDTAVAAGELTFASGEKSEVQFRLDRHHGLWQISDLSTLHP